VPALPITLIKGDKHGSEVDYRDNLPVNMYAVDKEIFGVKGYLLNYPGLTSFGIGTGIDRGGIYNERFGNHYRVSGTKLISVSTIGVTVELGNITGARQAAMPYSFNTQAIITDGKMWLYDGTIFLKITDSDLGNPIDGIWINGYYFLTDGEYIYHTDITDETAIDPLKFATAEFMPDPSLGLLKTQDNKVVVFGRYTTEYFVDIAQANFAFTRIESRAQKIGIVATHAKCELGGVFYITGGYKEESVGVYKILANSASKISTREIDKILAEYTELQLTDMRMETRFNDDVTFIIIHLPNETLCFNEKIARSSGILAAWSILKTDILGDTPYRGINGIFDPRIAKWICGDRENANLGIIDETVATHYDSIIEWILYTPFINIETASIDELSIETIPGFTIVGDATVALSLTYDGIIYGDEIWMQYGLSNDYNKNFIIRRLGYVSDFVGFKFRGVSESKMAFSLMKIEFS
jgi:hypothetical protein